MTAADDGQGDRLTKAELENWLRWEFWNPDNGGQWPRIAAALHKRILRDRARPADEDGLRTAKADVWDEGLLFGQQHWATNYGAYQNSTPIKAPNPYRAHPEPTTTETDV